MLKSLGRTGWNQTRNVLLFLLVQSWCLFLRSGGKNTACKPAVRVSGSSFDAANTMRGIAIINEELPVADE